MKYYFVIPLIVCCSILCQAQDTLNDNHNAWVKIKEFDSLWRVSHLKTFSAGNSSNIADLSVYTKADTIKDSLDAEDYNESSYLLSAYLLLLNTDFTFKKPDWYKGKIEKCIYALLLLDDLGFCEEFYIKQGIDEQLDEYVKDYFKNMPKVSFMRWNESNPPKCKIAVKKKIIPVIISFYSIESD